MGLITREDSELMSEGRVPEDSTAAGEALHVQHRRRALWEAVSLSVAALLVVATGIF
jgi:CO/xanthine dehydrogenase FAD-binding subunit